jgi:hypothetical protein
MPRQAGSCLSCQTLDAAMPLISGPHNSKYTFADGNTVRVDPPLNSAASTLGAALEEYGNKFNVVVRPCTKPLPGQSEVKYFEIQKLDGEVEWVVDVHIIRESEEICPKQDLTFLLLPNDQVEMGALAC